MKPIATHCDKSRNDFDLKKRRAEVGLMLEMAVAKKVVQPKEKKK